MEDDFIIFIGLIPAMLIGVVVLLWILKEGFIYNVYDWVYAFFGVSIGRYFTFGVYTLTSQQQQLISERIKYYRLLNDFDKKQFNHRVKKFIKNKEFISRGEVEITEEVQLLVAAKAVMLSFGFGQYELYEFSKILIYPREYYSYITKNYHKGEVNPKGIIVLSWQHFEEGIEDETDNINLAIHEFAHAYMNEAEKKSELEDMYGEPSMTRNLSAIENIFSNDKHTQQLKSVNAVRNYAYTNSYEFFAVACEYFFETPKMFKQDAPQLYSLIAKMLNQDTAKMGL